MTPTGPIALAVDASKILDAVGIDHVIGGELTSSVVGEPRRCRRCCPGPSGGPGATVEDRQTFNLAERRGDLAEVVERAHEPCPARTATSSGPIGR
jgi:hypothetical protein